MLTMQQELQALKNRVIIAEYEKAVMEEEMERIRKIGAAAFSGVAMGPSAPQAQQEMPVAVSRPVSNQPVVVRRRFHTSKDQIIAMIQACPQGRVEACLLKLESLQTSSEQLYGKTLSKNGRGFSKMHYTGETKYMLRYIKDVRNNSFVGGKRYKFSLLKNQGTTAWALKGLAIALYYARQLAEVSNEEGGIDWMCNEA